VSDTLQSSCEVGVTFAAAFYINSYVISLDTIKPVQFHSKSFLLLGGVLLKLHSSLELHNYFIHNQIFFLKVQCERDITELFNSISEIPKPTVIWTYPSARLSLFLSENVLEHADADHASSLMSGV
jgi:hypothetical protein